MVDGLQDAPAPQWGIYAQLLRVGLDAFLLYLPLALMGWSPSTPSYLSFIPTASYYAHLVWLAPLVIVCQWLLLAVILHVILRLGGRNSDIDQILNISGMAALVVGAFLVLWDWGWIILGWHNITLLGISHLVLDVWGIVIMVTGLKRILNVPVWAGILLSLLWIVLGLPLAILFIRGPF